MKIFTLFLCIWTFISNAQVIPYGDSQDTIVTSDSFSYILYYYKPSNYDSVSSPVLMGIHGLGGIGSGPRGSLKEIADRRKALFVGPTFPDGGYTTMKNLITGDWLITTITEMYRHVIYRENRSSIDVYLIGHSGGGQFVTRYMLFRKAIPDSIPVKMAISSNPAYYTFCTDSWNYACGLGISNLGGLITNQAVIDYYNSNYALLNGTADTVDTPYGCIAAQGENRYDRGLNFFAFSQSDAIVRGTTLKWQYEEVLGVGHDESGIYNTKLFPTDTSTIAEKLLFDSQPNTIIKILPDEISVNWVHPNPTTGKISVSNSSHINSIEIYNVLGEKVAHSNSPKVGGFNSLPLVGQGWALDFSNQPSGIYLLIANINGQIQSMKIIKQ